MLAVTWDHVHLRSPDPEATAARLEDVLGGEIVRAPGRIDVRLGGANVFIAPVTAGDGVNSPPATPYQGLIRDNGGIPWKHLELGNPCGTGESVHIPPMGSEPVRAHRRDIAGTQGGRHGSQGTLIIA